MGGRAEGRLPGFASHKTTKPIFYRTRWMRTALILATFNHEVLSLAPDVEAKEQVGGHVLLKVRSIRGRSRILLSDDQLLCSVPGTEILRKSDVVNQPLAPDCEAIWSYRTLAVSGLRRMAISAALPEKTWIQIGELQCVLGDKHGDIRSLLGLIAQGRIEIDITRSLSPASWIRIRQVQRPLEHQRECINTKPPS